MPQMVNAQTIAAQLEKVRDKVSKLYENEDTLLNLIQARGDVEKVSSRNMRLPLQIIPGGKAGSYGESAGLGRGSGTSYDVAQVTPIFFRFSVEISKLVEYATDSKEKAIANIAKKEVANGMKQFRTFLDKLAQTAGNGVLGTIGSVAGTVLTMNVPNGAALVYIGQTIQVYDTTLTTNRGTANVVSADPISSTQTITVDVLPAGTVATDVIVHDGLTGAQPISLYGIKYHQSNATTGSWLNLNRATYPVQLATPTVNAASSALVPGFVRLAINKVRKALGSDQVGKLLGYTAVEQEHAWENLGIGISTVIKEGGAGAANDLDLLFTGKKTMGGLPLKTSINADQTRIDFLDLSHWGRAVMKDIDFFEVGGMTVFPLYAPDGSPAAAYWFAYDVGFQLFSDSPRSGAYISTLARPTGY